MTAKQIRTLKAAISTATGLRKLELRLRLQTIVRDMARRECAAKLRTLINI